jgi:hypothetical protein
LFAWASTCSADDFRSLCADRLATERVYYNHRTGTKPSFEQAVPASLVEQLIRQEQQKELALKNAWNIEITPGQLAAEVQRIDATTRAPEILAELKAALGNDPARFARTVARPIVVERELRRRFENDDALHAGQRQKVEKLRAALLAAKAGGATPEKLLGLLEQSQNGQVGETTWQLGARPVSKEPDSTELQLKVQKQFGANAQVISTPGGERERKFWFDDLQPDLQNVLRAQLRQAGDVSAVIEAPSGFLLYVVREKTTESLSASVLSLPKRSYEEWIAEQGK